MKTVIHVEVLRRASSGVNPSKLRTNVEEEIQLLDRIVTGTNLTVFKNKFVNDNVELIQISDIDSDDILAKNMADLQKVFLPKDVVFYYHIYRLNTEGMQVECMDYDENEGDQPVANHWLLPSSDFHGLWESLVYDSNVKENLLSYMEATMLFSECGVNTNIISWNRLVLLHGPPGTGKTSLCKALAHKLTIRMDHCFSHGQLIEINSHSLFSKYFSESGKLVVKMFDKIRELIENKDSLVCVLIDEVESLTRARESSMSRSEPSDVIRAVNAVLTQIDQIRRYPNVMILTTSNITGAIDIAFLDRADIRQYIGLPTAHAIFKIYLTCIEELIRVNLISSSTSIEALSLERLELEHNGEGDNSTNQHVRHLLHVARLSEGLSGRTLRRIPFLAHALFVKIRTSPLDAFLLAMEQTVIKQKQEIK